MTQLLVSGSGANGLLVALMLVAASSPACSDSSGPSACGEPQWGIGGGFDPSPRIDFDLTCSTFQINTYDNKVNNEFGGTLSYDYDIRCEDGSNRHVGRVYDIEYDPQGNFPVSAQYTHNGASCIATF
jgi:hypothetical protein